MKGRTVDRVDELPDVGVCRDGGLCHPWQPRRRRRRQGRPQGKHAGHWIRILIQALLEQLRSFFLDKMSIYNPTWFGIVNQNQSLDPQLAL